MIDTGEVERRLQDPAFQATTLPDLVHVSSVLKNLSEVEKQKMERVEAQRKSEVLRFWIPILAPTISAFALVATLAVQINQFNKAAEKERSAAEDLAWREAIKNLSDKRDPVTLYHLRTFLTSKKYGPNAKELGIVVLTNLPPQAFDIFLQDIVPESDWGEFGAVIRLQRGLNRQWSQIDDDIDAAEATVADLTRKMVQVPVFGSRLPAAEEKRNEAYAGLYDVMENVRMTSRSMADFMRRNASTWPNRLDLSYTNFLEADLSNLPLTNAVLSNGMIRRGDISGSCLCRMVVDRAELTPASFANSKWANTAWWRAHSISPMLLTYLEQNYPFDSKSSYVGSRPTLEEYRDSIDRLHRKNIDDSTPTPPSA